MVTNAALHADGQDGQAGPVQLMPPAKAERCRRHPPSGLPRSSQKCRCPTSRASPNQPVCVLPETQLLKEAAGLLFIAAQQIGRMWMHANLESGLSIERYLPSPSQRRASASEGKPDAGEMVLPSGVSLLSWDVGHVALPPLRQTSMLAVVVRIEVKMLCFVQLIDKSGNVHLGRLLHRVPMVYLNASNYQSSVLSPRRSSTSGFRPKDRSKHSRRVAASRHISKRPPPMRMDVRRMCGR